MQGAAAAAAAAATTMPTTNDIRILIDSIQEKDEHLQKGVFNIIKKYTNKFTENQNGVFVDMTKLDHSVLKEIEEFLLSVPSSNPFSTLVSPASAVLPHSPSPSPPLESHGSVAINNVPSPSLPPHDSVSVLVENLTEDERLLCGLDYSSNRKKDLNLFRKKFTA
jgi:hypothetical protein